MKTIVTILALFVTISVNAQEFMGIAVGGTTQECINKFIAKGLRITVTEGAPKTVTSFVGKLNGEEIELNIVSTPISKKVWKFSVYFPKRASWSLLKIEYGNLRSSLISKYGQPNQTFASFTDPYYEGDGYELQAVRLEKCTYATFWSDIYIQISEYLQVNVVYQNNVNSELNSRERDQINQNIL